MLNLFDTHTHFDVEDFNNDRELLAIQAHEVGVTAIILIGFLQQRFKSLASVHEQLHQWHNVPKSYLAPGLHPFYIESHQQSHLDALEIFLKQYDCVAIGEIGLDYFEKRHKVIEVQQQQKYYFIEQLKLAQKFDKPVLLHIRKAHGDVLQLLKVQKFKHGGIAHAFSGGVEEAKAFIKLGFKIGVTGQITNPNAKRLHEVVKNIGAEHLVLETDCPDMTPLCCQTSTEHRTRNTPANLPYVLEGLSKSLGMHVEDLAPILWKNSVDVLKLNMPDTF